MTSRGFTIVELLIVIVVISILATISILAYTGIQDRARTANAQSTITQNSRTILSYVQTKGSSLLTTDVMNGGNAALKLDASGFKYVSFCTNGTDFVLAVQLENGDKYYSKSNISVIQDNSINSLLPCSSLSITSATTTYGNFPASSCASENSTCTFTGTATIAYGYMPLGSFTAQENMTSPVTCNNTTFGDPASGYGKACYILSN